VIGKHEDRARQRALVLDSITHVVSTPVAFDSGGRRFPLRPGVFGFYVDGAPGGGKRA
jgi:hypothetical protein